MRKMLRYIFASLVLATMTSELQAQTKNKSAQTTQTTSNTSKVKAELSPEQKETLSDILSESAKKKFLSLSAESASTAYAQKIKTIESEVNKSLEYFPDARCIRLVVLNHERFLTGVALGIEAPKVLNMLLEERGIDPHTVNTKALLSTLTCSYKTVDGATIMTTEPALVVTPAGCGILVLPSDYAPSIDIPGLTRQQVCDFIQQHEIAHAFDSEYLLTGYKAETVRNIDWNKPSTIYKPIDGYEIASKLCMKESWADAVAIVMALRMDPTIASADKFIDKIIASRINESPDHMSADVLEGLKSEISALGMKKLKKMDVFDVVAFCQDVNDKYGMTPSAVNTALAYLYGDQETVEEINKLSQDNWEIAKGVKFAQRLKNSSDIAAPAAVADAAVTKALSAWSAQDVLIGRAVQDSGYVSSESLVGAYGSLMDDLRQEAEKQPEISYLKMIRLTTCYSNLGDINVMKMNDKYKIDLLSALPEARALIKKENGRTYEMGARN
jgi:hypothetical protein